MRTREVYLRRPIQRDPADAGRQLKILAQLFREGEMPRDGVDILLHVLVSTPAAIEMLPKVA